MLIPFHLGPYRQTDFGSTGNEVYKEYAGTMDMPMRQIHVAGDKLFVDYAGQTIPIIDPATGEIKPASIFVAVLGASNYTFAEATW